MTKGAKLCRHSIVIGVALFGLVLGPLVAVAQSPGSAGPTELLTVRIAEHALAPGTTRAATEAWLKHWRVDYEFVSPPECIEIHDYSSKIALPAGTAAVLEGRSPLVELNRAAWSFVALCIYLDAEQRVITTEAAEPIVVD
jgi:hypothetical protein